MVYRNCPYCQSVDTIHYFAVKNKAVRLCKVCSLVFHEDRIDEKELIEYYRSSYYEDWGGDQDGAQRDEIYSAVFRFLEKHSAKGNMLDLGAGNGRFLALARNRGWKIAGQEISYDGCRIAWKKYGLKLINKNLKDMAWESEQFDVITMINMLDHLPDPWWVLKKAFRSLKRGGIIYVRVPNGYIHSFFYRISNAIPLVAVKQKIISFLVMHRYYLTKRFFEKVLKEIGFISIIIENSEFSKVTSYLYFSALDRLCLGLVKKYLPIINCHTYKLTKGKVLLSPSINIYASKF